MESSRTRIFGVAGNPVLHSKSPVMFNAAFESIGIDGVYTRIAASDPREVVECAKEMNIAGLNVTSPFKEGIMPFLDDVDDAAKRIGAVNTVVAKRGILKGYNTDPAGVVKALTAADVKLSGFRAAGLHGSSRELPDAAW